MASGVNIFRHAAQHLTKKRIYPLCYRCHSVRSTKINNSQSLIHRNYVNPFEINSTNIPGLKEHTSSQHGYHTSAELSHLSQEPKNATISPHKLVEDDLNTLCTNIKQEISTLVPEVEMLTHYHFDGQGKAFRPMVVMLAAKACNIHHHQNIKNNILLEGQKTIAYIVEMIHTASLVHDDVIDQAATRRGRPSVQAACGQRKAILTGNFIMSAACVALARIRHSEVVKILAQVLEDLVSGEFMQLGSKEDETERFNHYLQKTYKKTASLLANSCKAVAVLSGLPDQHIEHLYQYGRNIGIAFQLVDDLLDFISTEALMGKPTAADLKLGLATAPVLFAAHQHPELNPMIMRRFKEPGDIDKAWEYVSKSDGISHTKYLAEQHCKEAIRHISHLHNSHERQALITLTNNVLHRLK